MENTVMVLYGSGLSRELGAGHSDCVTVFLIS